LHVRPLASAAATRTVDAHQDLPVSREPAALTVDPAREELEGRLAVTVPNLPWHNILIGAAGSAHKGRKDPLDQLGDLEDLANVASKEAAAVTASLALPAKLVPMAHPALTEIPAEMVQKVPMVKTQHVARRDPTVETATEDLPAHLDHPVLMENPAVMDNQEAVGILDVMVCPVTMVAMVFLDNLAHLVCLARMPSTVPARPEPGARKPRKHKSNAVLKNCQKQNTRDHPETANWTSTYRTRYSLPPHLFSSPFFKFRICEALS
jgi:hypothetical protein